MNITMLYSKIHRATVTDANLNYVGSITIDQELLDAASMRVGQKIDIVNVIIRYIQIQVRGNFVEVANLFQAKSFSHTIVIGKSMIPASLNV